MKVTRDVYLEYMLFGAGIVPLLRVCTAPRTMGP